MMNFGSKKNQRIAAIIVVVIVIAMVVGSIIPAMFL